MNFFDKLEKKLGRFAIPNLTLYLVLGYVVGYVLTFVSPEILNYLSLDPVYIIKAGQIWRVISWTLIPPNTSIIWAIFMILLYYNLGRILERTWGTFRYNIYIFGGLIFTIAGAFFLYWLIGPNVSFGNLFSTYYINMSIFLAFATCYPDMEVRLYFLIPIKMKWMALVYVALAVYSAVRGGWPVRVAIIASLLNFLIFFMINRKNRGKQRQRQRNYRQSAAAGQRNQTYKNPTTGAITRHKCAICGRTEVSNPELEFRFCSKCNGNYEYCNDHLFTHEHKK